MKNTLFMLTEASYSLNFLVYIQNIFLNNRHTTEDLKFPYMPLEFSFREDFEIEYQHLWDEIANRLCEQRSDDMNIFYEEKQRFYERLFVENNDALHKFNEIYKSFEAWWKSIAGRFVVERSVDESGQKIYEQLSNLLVEKKLKPQKQLQISLIYDDSVLADCKPTPYFAIVSVKDCIVNVNEVVEKLQLVIQ